MSQNITIIPQTTGIREREEKKITLEEENFSSWTCLSVLILQNERSMNLEDKIDFKWI